MKISQDSAGIVVNVATGTQLPGAEVSVIFTHETGTEKTLQGEIDGVDPRNMAITIPAGFFPLKGIWRGVSKAMYNLEQTFISTDPFTVDVI